jgi:outer membrane biosynthesis protein TonB
MALPILKPNADAQIPQRRHTDPPGLWFYVTFGSVIIHLLGFGILRLLLMGNGNSLQSQQNIIPVDLITVAPTNTSSNQINPAPSSVTPQNPVAANPPVTRKLEPNSNRLVISTPTPPVISPKKQVKTPISFPSPNQPSTKPTQKSEVKPSNPQTTTTKPVSPSNNTPKPEVSATNSSGGNPSTPGTQTNQNPSTSQSGGGVISLLGKLQDRSNSKQPVIHPDDPNYNDKLAVLIEGNTHLSGDELKQLGIKLNQVVELKVAVVIETNGTATVLPKITETVRGNLSKDAAVALANKVVQQLRFQPTLMAGQPVPREYYIPVTITPNPK